MKAFFNVDEVKTTGSGALSVKTKHVDNPSGHEVTFMPGGMLIKGENVPQLEPGKNYMIEITQAENIDLLTTGTVIVPPPPVKTMEIISHVDGKVRTVAVQ